MTPIPRADMFRCLTWNIAGGVFTEGAPAGLSQDECADYVARCLLSFRPDIVALQEVPFFPQNESAFIDRIIGTSGMAHAEYKPISPSHLHENARLGMAVLSVHPLSSVQWIPLPNPNLIVELPDGSKQRTHDKMMVVAKFKREGQDIAFVSLHLPPFQLFKRRPGEPLFSDLKKVIRETILGLGDMPVAIAGDINTESLGELVPELLHKGGFFELIFRPTITGTICDQITCSRHWTDGSALVVPTWSDHALCVGDLTPAKVGAQVAATTTASSDRVRVLHLSDLHFGQGSKDDVDWKAWLETAERTTRAERLRHYLRSLRLQPDYVVISGDVTIAGHPDGFRQFKAMLTELIKDEVLPSADRVIIVPGNHDVTRKIDGVFAKDADRWSTFQQELGNNFVRPWLPGDPPIEQIERDFETQASDAASMTWGGVRRFDDPRTGEASYKHFPLIFDRQRHVLFYAFNSAAVSQTRIGIDSDTAKIIDAFQTLDQPNRPAIDKLLREFDRLREVDPARVNPGELYLFQSLMSAIRRKAPDELDKALKIIVVHHHIAPIYGEEVKQFELLLNAGQFKKQVVEEGFQVVLHGHKHWPEVFTDTAISGGNNALLSVVSGGTIGGWEARLTPGFFWLEFQRGGPATAAFVPLQDQNPRAVFTEAVKSAVNLAAFEPVQPKAVRGRSTGYNLRHLYSEAERSMIRLLRKQALVSNGERYENVGWNHFLGSPEVTPFGTAYGLHVMNFLNAGSSEFRQAKSSIRDTLLRMRRKNLCWSASSLGEPGQPIETAVVLGALARLLTEEELAAAIQRFEKLVEADDSRVVLDSTFGASLIAQTLGDHAPQSEVLARAVATLIQGARTDTRGRIVCWQQRSFASPDRCTGQEFGEPSVAHTAHALITLRRVHEQTQGRLGLASDDLKTAAQWLLSSDWRSTFEIIQESDGKQLAMSHYTAPLAMIALLLCEIDPGDPRISATAEELWRGQDKGLWWFGEVKWPVWATLVCLQALTEFTFRSGVRLEN